MSASPPIHVDKSASRQSHELLKTPSMDIVLDGFAHGFGTADARLQTHQFFDQSFIDSDRRSHNSIVYMIITFLVCSSYKTKRTGMRSPRSVCLCASCVPLCAFCVLFPIPLGKAALTAKTGSPAREQ